MMCTQLIIQHQDCQVLSETFGNTHPRMKFNVEKDKYTLLALPLYGSISDD